MAWVKFLVQFDGFLGSLSSFLSLYDFLVVLEFEVTMFESK